MISQVVTKYLRKTAENSYFWRSSIFYFCPEENRLIVSKSSWKKFLAYFNFCAHASYSAFLVVRLLQARYYNNDERDVKSELLLETFGLAFLVPPFCCQLCFFRREETFANFINQYLTHYRNNEDVDRRTMVEAMYENLMRFLVFVRRIMTPMAVLLPILKPEKPMFITSLIYSTTSPGPLARAMYGLPFLYIVLTWWSNVFFMVAWILGYVFSTLGAIRSLRLHPDKTALNTVQFAERYRCIQFLEQKANEIIKYPLAILKTVMLLLTIRCIYGFVKMEGYMRVFSLNSAIGYIISLAVSFKAIGQVYEKSEEVLYQKRKKLGEKWFRRFHRSCRPLKIRVAGLYFVDPPMSLTMGSFVIQNVANMLVLKS